MSNLNTLRDGLVDQLKDLYSAEKQLLKALPKMEKKATNDKLKKGFKAHLAETEIQVERLEEIASLMEIKLTGKTCKAMQGLLEEGKEVLDAKSDNDALLDAMLIGAARRVEHYEMAGYCAARACAAELGEEEVANLLSETFDEESATDEKLIALAQGGILEEANLETDEEEEEEDERPMPKGSLKKGRNGSNLILVMLLAGASVSLVKENAPLMADTVNSQVANEQEAVRHKVDNSGRNVRDRNETRVTADDQSVTDVEILAKIREMVVANNDLSSNAKNVKIIVNNKEVLLRGPVDSKEEMKWIEEIAAKAGPKLRVVNQLELTTP